MSVVALVTDLIFATKIKGTADQLGVPIRMVRTQAQLADAIGTGATLAIVDMNAANLDPADAIRQCKLASAPPLVIAYLSHVQQELAEAARAAGADLVVPRSRFSEQLPALLQQRPAPK